MEYATWSNSLRLELSRVRDVMQREAVHLAHRFRFVEVSDYTESDLEEIIEEMGTVPPYKGRSGFLAVWRDGGARLYEGQPQSMYLANWLLTLDTTLLYKPIQSKSARKSFHHQESVRVVGYFKQLNEKVDALFANYLEVAKRFHLDIEFAAVNDLPTAKFFKLRHIGDVAILKPSEPSLVWSQTAHFEESHDSGTSKGDNSGDTSRLSSESPEEETNHSQSAEDDEEDDSPKLWTYASLNKWIQRNKKPLWSEIKVASMFSYWFSTLPKVLLVVPNRDSLTRSEVVAHAFNNFKSLAKQYARSTGLEFLLLDASIFTQIPQALEITVEDLPAFVPFKDSKTISQHVLKIDRADSAKESYAKMKSYLDDYIQTQAVAAKGLHEHDLAELHEP